VGSLKVLLFLSFLFTPKEQGLSSVLDSYCHPYHLLTICCVSLVQRVTVKRGREIDSVVIRSGTNTTTIKRR